MPSRVRPTTALMGPRARDRTGTVARPLIGMRGCHELAGSRPDMPMTGLQSRLDTSYARQPTAQPGACRNPRRRAGLRAVIGVYACGSYLGGFGCLSRSLFDPHCEPPWSR